MKDSLQPLLYVALHNKQVGLLVMNSLHLAMHRFVWLVKIRTVPTLFEQSMIKLHLSEKKADSHRDAYKPPIPGLINYANIVMTLM